MQRHVGGVRGTVLWRGSCPVCGAGVAGGNMSRPPGEEIRLRPHKCPTDPLTGEFNPHRRHRDWCKGGNAAVAADRDLMTAWARQLRAAEERRRERWR